MRKPSRLVLHVDDHVHHLEPDKAHTCTQATRTSSQHNKEGQRLMDKILHTPKVLSGVRRLGCLAATTMTPSNTPGFNVVWWRNRGGLTCARFCPLEGGGSSGLRQRLACARFCPLKGGSPRPVLCPINTKQEWATGELFMLRSDLALAKPVQDFVHQLSCGRRSNGSATCLP